MYWISSFHRFASITTVATLAECLLTFFYMHRRRAPPRP